jgi:hypothetical protein
MGIDYDAIAAAGGIGKGESAADGRRQRKLTKKQLLADAYAEVDRLDKGVSWVTGRHLKPGAVEARDRLERHHFKGRRVMPEWRHDADRIITVSGEEHDLITRGKLVVEGVDRRKPVFFHWNCKPESRPFHILPTRMRKVA